ncbi:AraC family transcriptional regulator [Rhodococcus spelaei]|uniref:AraC family transcriptional regulator n=1 Tax=Rhodococcus spelaei TaxID=2546320 RepID=A0A541B0W1_9NOCA|nr:helix-turn-helix domain-containing protein [Rhodococcus spelaei]TQF65940.1 AraC family transcriptional regulator [Rhodococcus spelaei]
MTEPRGVPEAIVRPDEAAQSIEVSRRLPRDSLRAFVEYLWIVHWRVDGVRDQQVLPQPKIHLATEDGRLLVHGVNRDPFHRRLAGTGHVIGVAFRAGGFRPFLRSSVGDLAGAVLPVGPLVGVDDGPVAAAALATTDNDAMADAVEDYLESLSPQLDPAVDRVSELVTRIEQDTSIHRVDEVAALAGLSVRTLQRLFTEYVGIGPKWVIRRHRLLDAAERAHSGTPIAWAELADELGFSDQAHLIRDFTAAVGTPPATYVRQLGGGQPLGG